MKHTYLLFNLYEIEGTNRSPEVSDSILKDLSKIKTIKGVEDMRNSIDKFVEALRSDSNRLKRYEDALKAKVKGKQNNLSVADVVAIQIYGAAQGVYKNKKGEPLIIDGIKGYGTGTSLGYLNQETYAVSSDSKETEKAKNAGKERMREAVHIDFKENEKRIHDGIWRFSGVANTEGDLMTFVKASTQANVIKKSPWLCADLCEIAMRGAGTYIDTLKWVFDNADNVSKVYDQFGRKAHMLSNLGPLSLKDQPDLVDWLKADLSRQFGSASQIEKKMNVMGSFAIGMMKSQNLNGIHQGAAKKAFEWLGMVGKNNDQIVGNYSRDLAAAYFNYYNTYIQPTLDNDKKFYAAN